MNQKIDSRKVQIVALLKKYPRGLTASEIADKLGLTPPCVSGRCSELWNGRKIVKKEKRKCKMSNKLAHVWGIK
jgi:predicted transcriptional regulator